MPPEMQGQCEEDLYPRVHGHRSRWFCSKRPLLCYVNERLTTPQAHWKRLGPDPFFTTFTPVTLDCTISFLVAFKKKGSVCLVELKDQASQHDSPHPFVSREQALAHLSFPFDFFADSPSDDAIDWCYFDPEEEVTKKGFATCDPRM